MMTSVAGRPSRVWAILAGVGLVLSLSLTATAADAAQTKKKKKKGNKAKVAQGYTPPFASLVVDANSGKVLHAKDAHELRHPASVTKVMTLYMMFEQLERGKMTLDTPIVMSSRAAAMPPSKLGLNPGQTIRAEDAIKALVTKSANDVATAVSEHIGGSEARFAEMMTAKAHSIGMTRTNYANASGLPNPRQITTAHDLVILGRAVQERYPKYYRYFSTHNFAYAGRSLRNHNRLLGQIEGIDGIKTGFTNASGFNLLSSVHRDGQHIVAVVIGGRTAASRDRIMANLIEDKIQYASRTKTAPSVFAQARQEPVMTAAAVAKEKAPAVAAVPEPTTRVEVARPEPVRNVEPQRPVQVAAVGPVDLSKARQAQAPAPQQNTTPYRGVSLDGSNRAPIVAAAVVPAAQAGSNMRWVSGPAPADPRVEKVGLRVEPKTAQAVADVAPVRSEVRETARPSAAAKGVMIQIGATDSASKANELLSRAKAQSRGALNAAVPFTEKVSKGGETLYRARFAGLNETQAETACKSLKRSGMSCFATKN